MDPRSHGTAVTHGSYFTRYGKVNGPTVEPEQRSRYCCRSRPRCVRCRLMMLRRPRWRDFYDRSPPGPDTMVRCVVVTLSLIHI